ncbi:5-formyltetrahydrofolate cyclo-ligase [Acinetobacter sp. ANC 4648]|uniref:5-formyltetrahydrofolate cyclo-ligase n=1 Tax=Acinetobacter sp. ANC 4648 TaxID=1977875 RepID=UPI000A33ACEA|nr:5-formyltetrahydrofolate cyclo-ligase [Acinetobacter sp. ANC 4648]OTG81732.1 5-formyltetrahydrofolate cyclo-ligase [Acinetobacter sp. ANC 4648]
MSNQILALRQKLRKKRLKVSTFQQRQTENAILNRLRQYPKFKNSHKIGVYLHAFGEVFTHKIIEYCFTQHKAVYLPMICNMNQRLVWIRITRQLYKNKRFSMHRLGMLEPMASRGLPVSQLDLLIMPLLIYDQTGTRIGMGGGFYDRTLASAPYQPYRLGLAHDFQLSQHPLIRNAWDQPIDALLTPTTGYRFKRHFSQ